MAKDRSAGWLNATQFFTALNDSTFKLLVIFCLIHRFCTAGSPGTLQSGIVAAVGAVYVIPFLLFSHVGGYLADRFSRKSLLVWLKAAEIGAMLLGAIAFASGSTAALYAACFLVATQGALFVPVKYCLLQELVQREGLAKANGSLISFTFIALIASTPLAAVLSEISSRNFGLAAVFCVAVAVLGTLAALPIRWAPAATAPADPSPLFVRSILATLRGVSRDSYLLLAIISSASFAMIAAFMQLNLIPYGMQVLHISQERSSYLFLVAVAGIAVSAFLSGRLSGRNIEFGLVPLGAAGLAIACALLYSAHSIPAVLAVAAIAGLSVGFFTVPLETFLQTRSPRPKLGQIIAAANFLGYVGVLLAAGLIYLTGDIMRMTAAQGFLVAAGITLVLAIGTAIVLPDFLVRFIIVTITRVIYRIRATGLENVPVEGPAMLLPNHVTFVDALFLASTIQRRIRFVMLREMYEDLFWLRPLCRLMRVIPISEKDSPKQLVAAFKAARAALDDGYLVCIFPEGQLSRNGNLSPFKAGFQHIVRRSGHPVIPVFIGGGWGSIFSYAYGKPVTAFPRRIPYPVDIVYGAPMPSDTPPYLIRLAIGELSSDWQERRKRRCRSMGELLARSARRHWFRPALSDTTGRSLAFGKTLVAATALAAALKPTLRGQDKVGLVFPASVGGALANYAVTMLGKVTVNLNFTASSDAVASAISQCGIRTVITSRKFMAHLKTFTVPCDTIFLEDILPGIAGHAKLVALLKAIFLPARRFAGTSDFNPDSILTILFSSGTTAEPKGVLLSHYNIISNTEAFGTVLRFTHDDRLCAALPFFHSFGFTCTLWFPLIAGFSVAHHPNPLEGDKIAQVVRENRSTVLLATPTFLLTYIRRAGPDDFASLRIVITGAEKLRSRTAGAFKEKFKLAPLEGYGVTELSPVVSVNIPDVDLGGVLQRGTKDGTIGQPIPGVTAKVVGADGTTPLPPGEEGLLCIKGPNVMRGYLNKPAKTAEVIRNGWYETGDIAKIDEEGFVTITDRASRFSKLGGEMVPHLAIEETYLKALNVEERVVVVTSVPDEARGERLVVLFTDAAGTAESLHGIIDKSDLPNLWKPRADDYVKVAAMPVLGSGKLDLKGVKQIALGAKTGK